MANSYDLSPRNYKLLLLPLAFTAAFSALSLLPDIRQHSVLGPSFWGWSSILIVWLLALSILVFRGTRRLSLEFRPIKQHYLQATIQIIIYTYWGWYWQQIYDVAVLILAQIVFAYAFDMLLAWSRREKYILGFGQWPIILSINLFLLFREDWFYLQFLLVAVGFLGKDFVRWQSNGKSTHIFNPSAFSLGIFSLVLILTGTTDWTWGREIATNLSLAPNIYLLIFLLGLIVMYFFYTTLLTMTSAITLFGLSALYMQATGVPYFIDSEIPIAVFLGLHLLITDPSTSPRTPIGKVLFGLLYGLGVFGLYELLGRFGAPTFYDKLLCVPLLNLSVRVIDRYIGHRFRKSQMARLSLDAFSKKSNLIYMIIWAAFFVSMALIGSTDGKHTGDSVPFWQQACDEDRVKACERLLLIKRGYCLDNVGWACNELGVIYAEGVITDRNSEASQAYLKQSCALGFWTGCVNIRGLSMGAREMKPGSLSRDVPGANDLRALLRQGGKNLLSMSDDELLARACDHGWTFACSKVDESL